MALLRLCQPPLGFPGHTPQLWYHSLFCARSSASEDPEREREKFQIFII